MKKILVPCDFSPSSIEAFKFATEIVKKSKGEIWLLHVCELPVLFDSAAVMAFEKDYMKDVKVNAEDNFKKIRTKWAPDTKVKTLVEFGGILSMIRGTITRQKIDLVVMGTQGASGIKEFTIGSNAEKVVRSSPVPVITVRTAPKAIRSILFATTPDMEHEELIQQVKRVQEFFGAKLNIVYINTPARFSRDSEIKKSLKDFTRRFMLKDYSVQVWNDTDEVEGIKSFAAETKPDMVLMRTHGRKGITHLAIGSVAEDVVNHLKCPIWTYRVK